MITTKQSIVLSDFGLSVFVEGARREYASLRGGAYRWLPPESFEDDTEDFRPTFAGDIYAFACVCIEVILLVLSVSRVFTTS